MYKQTHFFYAIKIPLETKLIMKKNTEKLKEILPFSTWVHHEDLHITLAFLGNAPSEKLTRAIENVQATLRGSEGFMLDINNLGTFGKLDSPRIFWADTKESNELQVIREKVFSACLDAGFQLETRPFKPHITLARKWTGDKPFQKNLRNVWDELQSETLLFNVKEVVLYQTHLDRTPKYEEKTIYKLK